MHNLSMHTYFYTCTLGNPYISTNINLYLKIKWKYTFEHFQPTPAEFFFACYIVLNTVFILAL